MALAEAMSDTSLLLIRGANHRKTGPRAPSGQAPAAPKGPGGRGILAHALSNRSEGEDVTHLLSELSRGNRDVETTLIPLVYDELRRIARALMRGEGHRQALQTTALVHEAYLRLTAGKTVAWEGRTHFFAVSAKVMRRVLVDQARARNSEKRGGGLVITVDTLPLGDPRVVDAEQLLALDAALERLAALDERQSQNRRDAILCRHDRRRDRPRAGDLAAHRKAGVADGEGVALWRADSRIAWPRIDPQSACRSVVIPAQWQAVRDVFVAALDVDEPDRAEFVSRETTDHPEVGQEVQRLLRLHRKAGTFLETSDETVDRQHPFLLSAGEVVAERFEVVRAIGQGGMGEVYRGVGSTVERAGRAQGHAAGDRRRERDDRAFPSRGPVGPPRDTSRRLPGP